MRALHYPINALFGSLLFALLFVLTAASPSFVFADTEISADTLDFDRESGTYRARGSVVLRMDGVELGADSVTFNESTTETLAEGDVTFEDEELSIKAERLEMNLRSRLGTLYGAKLLLKRGGGYRIRAERVELTGPGEFTMSGASITTCDSPIPAWCLKAKKARLIIGGTLTASDVTLNILDVPVMYTPVMSAPVLIDRTTGLLEPTVGFSDVRGFSLKQPFFWAISEEADTTVTAEYYSKRAGGGSFEYRRIAPGGMEGSLFGRYITDRELDEDFLELRAQYVNRQAEHRPGLNALLDINYVNEPGFFRTYEPYLETRAERFYESNAELSLPLSEYSTRLYLKAHGLIDLKEEDTDAPQTLPALGAELYPTPLGPIAFSVSTQAARFSRDESAEGGPDAEGIRSTIAPRVEHSVGRAVTLYQSAVFRKSYYSLRDTEDADTGSFEYMASARTSLSRNYGGLTHTVEPSVSYLLRSVSGDEPPEFDSLETAGKSNAVTFSLMNRISSGGGVGGDGRGGGGGGQLLTLRTSQTLDDENADVFTADINIVRPISIRAMLRYDTSARELISTASELSFGMGPLGLSAGQRYRHSTGVEFYSLGFTYGGGTAPSEPPTPNPSPRWEGSNNASPPGEGAPAPSEGARPATWRVGNPGGILGPYSIEGRLWYDSETQKLTDATVSLNLRRQCWGFKLSVVRTPDDTSVLFKINLLGLSSLSF